MRFRNAVIFFLLLLPLPSNGESVPQTPRTKGLVREMLTKLDSTEYYSARREHLIDSLKSMIPDAEPVSDYSLHVRVADAYANFEIDSSLFYLNQAIGIAQKMGSDSLRIHAELTRSMRLSDAGFNMESYDILKSIPREAISGRMLVHYFSAWAAHYHSLYSGFGEPDDFRERYREEYNTYRDSLLMVADTMSFLYLRNIERKEARAGNYAQARRYNAIRMAMITDPHSGRMATCLYDRFAIAHNYEHHITGEAMDDLLQSAIIEVENSNQNIASLLRVEGYLISIDEVKAAQKVSDYYFFTLQRFGSRKRLLEGIGQTMVINSRTLNALEKSKNQFQLALILISLLGVVIIIMLVHINRARLNIIRLNEDLQRSDKISKDYVGVLFQVYSSYIKRLEVFRTKIYSSLKKGNVEQALSLTSPMNDVVAVELKELYKNFDSAFIDIFPNYIETVNACFKPESRIIPKRTEILTTELRILALIKLGIEDSTKIAELLHCSVKTVYNLRSALKSRLAIPVEEFRAILFKM